MALWWKRVLQSSIGGEIKKKPPADWIDAQKKKISEVSDQNLFMWALIFVSSLYSFYLYFKIRACSIAITLYGLEMAG